MRRALLAGIFSALTTVVGDAQQNNFLSVAPEPQVYAWWLRTEFHPFDVEVRGISIGKIRATWCKATEFRKDLFPSNLQSELDQSRGLSFAVDGFFNGSKTKQTALVGVYESCAGEKGTFLLVLDSPRSGPPTIRFIQEMPADHQFAMLRALPDSTILVFHCMLYGLRSCDSV
jgi:hypothetical protein